MKTCLEHKKELKGPNSKGVYWHVIDFDKKEFCHYTEEEYNAIPDDNENPKEVKEPVVDPWIGAKEKESSGMMRMAAQKNAAQVVAAWLARPDNECPKNITELIIEVSDKLLMWLKDPTSSSLTASSDRADGGEAVGK